MLTLLNIAIDDIKLQVWKIKHFCNGKEVRKINIILKYYLKISILRKSQKIIKDTGFYLNTPYNSILIKNNNC